MSITRLVLHLKTKTILFQTSSHETYEMLEEYSKCFSNVHMVKNRVSIHYAGFSRLQADINAMEELLEVSNSWRHLINLCGRDFPLKTNDRIEGYLKEKLEL